MGTKYKMYGCLIDEEGDERILGLDNDDDDEDYTPEYWIILNGTYVIARFYNKADAEAFVEFKQGEKNGGEN